MNKRTRVSKEEFELLNEFDYPRDAEWKNMPDVGQERWPTYQVGMDMPAWASAQADAQQRRDVSRLDWDGLADTLDNLGRILRHTKSLADGKAKT